MAEYTLTTPTFVPEGGAIPFTNTVIKGCCNVRHRPGSGIVKLKGGTCCKPNKYFIRFHGVTTDVPGTTQLGIFLDGELLPETLMSANAQTADDVLSMDAATEVCLDGCCSNVSVRVVAGTTTTVNAAAIIIHKEE